MTHDITDHSPLQRSEGSSGQRHIRGIGHSPLKRLTLAATAGALAVAGLSLVTAPSANATEPNTVSATITAGGAPRAIAVSPDGSRVYVANGNDGTVSVIDTATETVTNSITVGSVPFSIAITPNGTRAYVVNYGDGSMSVIDTATNTVTATIAPLGAEATFVAISPDGASAYVVNTDWYSEHGSVSVIDTATNTMTDTIGVGNHPQRVAFTGTHAYVTNNGSDSVSVIDTATKTVTASFAATAPGAISISPDGSRGYFTEGFFANNAISMFSTATNSVIGSPITVGMWPVDIRITPDGNRAYVVNWAGASVSVIDTNPTSGTYNSVDETIAVGLQPEGIAISPVGRYAYVANRGGENPTGTVSVLYLGAPPGAPTAVSAVAGEGSATVSWTAPASAGDSAITGYTVRSNPDGLTCASPDVATTSCVVSGLTNGTSYTFTVTAHNSLGESVSSVASNEVTLGTDPVPVPVPDPVVVPGGQQVVVPPGVTSVDFPNAAVSLGAPSLAFDGSTGPVTATVQPVTNPTAPSATPFVVGLATLVDITVVGASGPVEICINGDGQTALWHFDGQAWVDVTTRHTDGRVCGTVTSFSPFAVAPAKKIITFTTNDKPTLQGTRARLMCTAPSFIYTLNGTALSGSPTYSYVLSGARGTLATKWSRSTTVKFTRATKNARWVRCTVTATQAGTSTTTNPSEPVHL